MHRWGDNWFNEHGNDLDDAIHYCKLTWRRYGRIGSHGKEKWGSFRDHIYIFDGTLQSLIWPGYARIMGNSWFYWNIDNKIIRPLCIKLRIVKLVRWYQAQVYNYAIQKMCKRYPSIVDELVSDLDGYEMVRPGRFGSVDGTTIHKKYWTTWKTK